MLPNVLRPNETDHVPVLAEEVRELLDVQPGETVVDATYGAGGHAALLAADLRGEGRFVAIDRDPSVRPYFERFRRRAGVPARLLRGDFSIVLEQLAGNGFGADAILLDLGVSSMQLDRPERGFSYAADAPLDMRMDPTQDVSARDVVNTWSERERGCTCPPDFPVCVCGHEPELRALQWRPIRPSQTEVAANPRSAAARLRVAVK